MRQYSYITSASEPFITRLETMKKAVFAVGRFQPPTVGHALMIQEVMKYGGDAFIFVSSSTSPKDQNPLTVDQKITALQKMFPAGVEFVNTATCQPKCGGPVAANEYLRSRDYTDITLIAGSDRAGIFGPTADMWKSGISKGVAAPNFKGLERTSGVGATAMSGTKARKLALEGNEAGFAAAVRVGEIDDTGIRDLYNAIRGAKKGGGGEDIDGQLSSFDADMEGGRRRRKTRRIKKSKASGRALYRRGLRSRNGSSKTSRS